MRATLDTGVSCWVIAERAVRGRWSFEHVDTSKRVFLPASAHGKPVPDV
jgi:hypothetical protein